MKKVGWMLLVAGVLVGIYGLAMDTTVETESIYVPGVGAVGGGEQVYNIGLQAKQRNTLIVAGVLVVLGGVFIATGGDSAGSGTNAGSGAGAIAANQKKCPYCAETILQEARVCRFCGRDLAKQGADAKGATSWGLGRIASKARLVESRQPVERDDLVFALAQLEALHDAGLCDEQSYLEYKRLLERGVRAAPQSS